MSDPQTPDEETELTLQIPRMIDGDAIADVEKTILAELPRLLDDVAAYLDDAVLMLANAERSRIVQADKGIDALQLQHAYDESDRAGSLARLTGAAKALCAAASELD